MAKSYWDSRYAVHHIPSKGSEHTTTCGVDVVYRTQGIYDSWRGVTCKRCKATKKRTATKRRSKAR